MSQPKQQRMCSFSWFSLVLLSILVIDFPCQKLISIHYKGHPYGAVSCTHTKLFGSAKTCSIVLGLWLCSLCFLVRRPFAPLSAGWMPTHLLRCRSCTPSLAFPRIHQGLSDTVSFGIYLLPVSFNLSSHGSITLFVYKSVFSKRL